ncbi:hypothetical protein HBH56_085850 [Parastagonospora nodorum]|uniref:Uncharacterized protein n=1 Tax=Phaeosphaeria nodorum (strain SN15 / ATCC MYA-4574 / FGSC 10173) TaxID=321614 RepID=A0A7U2I009_PHANO|nr:hypothetical protein HBH56_085850 [Parastagonospora nodorum]QRC96928.1 hypothetical protein JI435_018060 [Parastagonospora nodorum SN15]KAH3955704.1 hypothetical protein HBH53_008600 [Parastagonospora nodorum]KAH3982448.1 hypothetical protein HBH52_081560 [Parastagonospora nodorum]KAH4058727.1 hypothetical protein HBH49_036900 [Parastagonospora nodorum]
MPRHVAHVSATQQLLWNEGVSRLRSAKASSCVEYLHAAEGCIVAEAQPCCATAKAAGPCLTGRRISTEAEHPLVSLQKDHLAISQAITCHL